MPIIHVNIIAGRPAEKRRALLKAVAEAAAGALDVPLTTVRVLLTEVAPDHWTVGGEPKAPPQEKEAAE